MKEIELMLYLNLKKNGYEKVGLKILPPGKPSPEARRKWLDELHKRETELLK